ncbi:hypothetical protein LCGC14_1572070 [marine sediment metagenome]|uniref:PD(D/E)XK endonuclease domain-containing protein n=1 Tax=marine sediment metagenome TaxID=412755 RepID=A0A0F9L0J2_9ZZZZ
MGGITRSLEDTRSNGPRSHDKIPLPKVKAEQIQRAYRAISGRGPPPKIEHPVEQKHRGGYSELIASAWLLECGFEVYRNVSPHGVADLVATKDGNIELVDVKTVSVTKNHDGSFTVSAGPLLKPAQREAGVRLLYVTPDGLCAWDTRLLDDHYNSRER